MDNLYIVIEEDFLEYETGILKIGGVQTYMYNLALLAQELGHKVFVFQLLQCSEKTTEYEGITVRFINSKNNQKTFNALYDKYNTDNSIFVIATDMMNVSCKNKNVISINHGIAFDIPGYEIPGFWKKNRFLQHANKCLRCISNIRRFYQVPNTVCVDYNFYNWLRTFGTIYPDKRVKVIPNYASSFIEKEELIEKITHRSDVIKIVFARRFVEYRGSRLFAYVIDELLEKYNIDVTFAGKGPDEKFLKEHFKNNPRVHFTLFSAKNSVQFHKSYDIAVVPTIFSEGTSLSLCEAMAAGCFCISTHVGGLSNIILDHYNGLLSLPEKDSLKKTIEEALTMNKKEFDDIAINSYWSARKAFGLELWKKKWSDFIKEIKAASAN